MSTYGPIYDLVESYGADGGPARYVLVRPDGSAAWGSRIAAAEKELGQYGIGRAFLAEGSRLRIAMSDCALVLPKKFAPNPYASAFLAHVAGVPVSEAPETRGPVILFAWDPLNEWNSTRPFDVEELSAVMRALSLAGCSASAVEGESR